MAKVLIIDDNRQFSESLHTMMQKQGHQAICAATIKEGLKESRRGLFDVILLNNSLQDGDGIEAIPRLVEMPSRPEVIILTDTGHPDEAERAIKNGGWGYLEKTTSSHQIFQTLDYIERYRQNGKARPRSVSLKNICTKDIIGKSPKLKACFDLLAQAATCDTNVLINGETGTGKELFALAIHNNSSRAKKNFVVVDCAALPRTLVESTLFGHERGAFTGADRSQQGLIKQADHGTLFLDEVGELPLAVQKAFLRVLEERRFRPIGSLCEIDSNFRLIAATNQDLTDLVSKGKFRGDLLFRLRAITMQLPPLRERRDDTVMLAMHRTNRLCTDYGLPEKKFASDFLAALQSYNWPGNVRELFQALDRARAAAGDEPILFAKHLPTYIRIQLVRASVKQQPAKSQPANGKTVRLPTSINQVREMALAEAEEDYLNELVTHSQGRIQEACRISGISRSRLYALFKKYQISFAR